jgi:hypothetical protein
VKTKISVLAAVALLTAAGGYAAYSKSAGREEAKGTVQRYLMNPEGSVDGFLLEDGTQVHFPPHLSSQITEIVSPKDAITLRGEKENGKVFRAETITNVKTAKSLTETPPAPPARPALPGKPGMAPQPPPPLGGPQNLANLQQLSAEGKVKTQLFGRRGEVNAVILSDDTIVHFGPRVQEDSKAKFNVGDNLKVSGFGTKNAYGQSIEATQLSNL